MADSDSGDEPEINHYAFMAKVVRDKTASAQHVIPMSINPRKPTPEEEAAKAAEENEKKQATNFSGIALRLLVATVFVGIGVGALVYSVYKSEIVHATTAPPLTTTTPKPHYHLCNPFFSQIAPKGQYKYTTRSNSSASNEITVPASWYQDNDLQVAKLTVGNSSYPTTLSITYANLSAMVTYKNGMCNMTNATNYESFINSFGGTDLLFERESNLADHNNSLVETYFGQYKDSNNYYSYTLIRYQEPTDNATMIRQLGWTGYPYGQQDFFDTVRYEYWFGDYGRLGPPNATDIACPYEFCPQYC